MDCTGSMARLIISCREKARTPSPFPAAARGGVAGSPEIASFCRASVNATRLTGRCGVQVMRIASNLKVEMEKNSSEVNGTPMAVCMSRREVKHGGAFLHSKQYAKK